MNADRPINNVVVLVAMEAEAKPMTEKLKLTVDSPSKLEPPAPFVTHSGNAGGLSVTLVTLGKCQTTEVDNVGTVPAALATYLTLQTVKPDLLINAGTAGGFISQGAKIGDVYVSTSCVHHDRRIPIPKFDEYGLGMKNSVSTKNLREHLGLKPGIVSSGNSLDYTRQCMEIMKANSVAVKDMEAAAVAWVADLFKTPLFCVKSITDLVDGDRPAEEEFLENLHSASEALQETIPEVLKFVYGKRPTDL